MRNLLILLSLAVVTIASPIAQISYAGDECKDDSKYLEPFDLPMTGSCDHCYDTNPTPFPQVKKLADDSSTVSTPAVTVSPLCFEAVMKDRPRANKSYKYASCSSATSAPQFRADDGKIHPAPCVDNDLLGTLSTDFAATTACTGADPRELFATFGWESHFQPNIINPFGNVGIGQLTSIGTWDVDINHRFRPFEQSSKPQCEKFASIFNESSSRAEHRVKHIPACSLLGSNEAIDRNLLYAEAEYLFDKNIAARLLKKLNVVPGDRSRIQTELAREMYNGGSGAVSKAFGLYRLYALSEGGGAPVDYKEFNTKFTRDYLAKDYGVGTSAFNKDAAKRASLYPGDIKKYVIDKVNRSNVVPKESRGSCVNY